MLDEVDRVVAVAGNAGEAELLGRVAAAVEERNLEVILVSDEARSASRAWSLELLKRIVRECPRQQGFPLADADLAWVARHLTRTKLGVALGAGGAKGYGTRDSPCRRPTPPGNPAPGPARAPPCPPPPAARKAPPPGRPAGARGGRLHHRLRRWKQHRRLRRHASGARLLRPGDLRAL